MPRYYFTVTDGRERVGDNNDVELADAAAARASAERLARNLANAGANWQGWSVEVRDELDQALASGPISPARAH